MVSPFVSDNPPCDRLEFCVRFVCGAVFGTLLGLLLVWRILPDGVVSWLTLLAGVLFFGLLAAIWGDRFWHILLGLFRWW
jgi:hypothetical protein